jgi:hypothetical protein
MKEALAQVIHQNEKQQGTCPECGSEQGQTQGNNKTLPHW